jgi:hypothetical protein
MLSKLLSRAVQIAKELPQAIQDELAEQFIEDIENEVKWQETLSKRSYLVNQSWYRLESFRKNQEQECNCLVLDRLSRRI